MHTASSDKDKLRKIMAARKEVEKAVHLREFQRAVSQLLSPEDRDYLFYAMKEYNTYKSVAKLMLALNSCLDTPEKLDLLPYVRELIPKHDRKHFDNLASYARMAHPLKVHKANGDTPGRLVSALEREDAGNSSRIITLQRGPETSLGFSIRGGREHDLGIFISHVDSFSQAEQSGLQVGDQIMAVNGISFDRLSHSSAVLVLKSHDCLKIEVKNMGCVPGERLGQNSFIWVDPSGNPVEEQNVEAPDSKNEKREGESGSRLLSSVDRHKVVLHTSKKRPLGFSVRGGAEYGLGIYISMVDKGSPADEAGLQVGDQIVDINGHSFASIFHQEAVYILRSYPTLILTIKSLGKLPTLAPSVDNNQEDAKANEKEKGSLRARSFSLPRKFSFKGSPSFARKNGTEDKPRVATVKRSQSTSERRSLPTGTESVDFGTPSNGTSKQRPNSSAGGFAGNSLHNRKKPISVSPLATHESRAPTSTNPSSVTPKFFEQGLGSQVMLASTSSQAKELLLDQARRKISANAVTTLKEKLEKYEQNGNIKELVDSLIPLLDTPSKMKLLMDVRSVLNPAHIVDFDEMVSPMELQALHKSDTDSESSEEDHLFDYNTVLSSTEQQRWSRMMPLQSREKKPSLPDLGVLGGVETRRSLLQKSSVVASSDPNLSGRAQESAVEHHNREPVASNGMAHTGINHSYSFSKPSPIVVEIPKDSTFLGMAIKGGIDTPLKNVYVRELRQGGAVHNEGFVQPGFEIVQVDDRRIRGKTYNEAVESIAECYNSDNTTIKLIVIPNQ